MNVTANHRLCDEAAEDFARAGSGSLRGAGQFGQRRGAKTGSEAYDVSKAALSHLVRELAIVAVAENSRQWHQPGHGGERLDHVSARSRDRFAEEIRNCIRLECFGRTLRT